MGASGHAALRSQVERPPSRATSAGQEAVGAGTNQDVGSIEAVADPASAPAWPVVPDTLLVILVLRRLSMTVVSWYTPVDDLEHRIDVAAKRCHAFAPNTLNHPTRPRVVFF